MDTGGYSIARRYLQDGLQPPAEAIRVEGFVSSFDQGYHDSAQHRLCRLRPERHPTRSTPMAPPFAHWRAGVWMKKYGRRPTSSLFIDVSGSMAQENRLSLVKQSPEILVDRMRADDTIAYRRLWLRCPRGAAL
ncbi:MAG: von Willebrand factor type A domain-containing protein [Anaerolineaceae bacterium]|nr:von Willebrand factor type A domain-containing protein [Anaerolineaceae bacterium]